MCVVVHVMVLLFLHFDSVCYGPCDCGVVLTYWQCESWSILLCCSYILTVFVMVHVVVLFLHIDSVCYGPFGCVVLRY